MVSVGTILYTLYARFVLFIILILIALPLLLCLLLPQRFLIDNKLFKIIAAFFYTACVKLSLLPIRYEGSTNFPNQPCIFIANHQSGFDIPLLGYLLKNRTHIWVAWEELSKGWLLRFILNRNALLVDVSTSLKGMRSLIKCINGVKNKPWDIIIFPEGARYTDGEIHNFFGGFAILSQKTNRPVIPIKITGVQKVYPPHTFWIYYHPITITIGAPLEQMSHESLEVFTERAYNWFITSKD